MGAIPDVVRERGADGAKAYHKESVKAQPKKVGLLAVILAMIGWQDCIQKMQESMAQTLQRAGAEDMKIYEGAAESLKAEMGLMPPAEGKDAAILLQRWQAKYNKLSQSWQNLETQWNSVIQSLDQNVQTQGSSSQQASQMVAVIIQAVNIVTRLLQAPLS